MKNYDEHIIIEQLRDPATQRAAFETIVKQYSEQLYWQIRRMVLSHDEANDLLQKALQTLPEKQRIVFNLKYFQDMKYEQISEILGTTVGALKASYHYAVKKIERILKDSL